MKYAKDVLVSTLKNVAHRSGLLYQRRFDPHLDEVTEYDLKVGYESSHSYALAAVPRGARVLDVGSSVPGVAEELAKKGCEVTVVQQHPLPVDSPRVRAVVQDLNDDSPSTSRRTTTSCCSTSSSICAIPSGSSNDFAHSSTTTPRR